jgi:mannose-6-phosphate isomerase-like protein (cupin superfamily)
MTDGQSITLQSGSEGTGPPPHSHAWEEAFFVLDGAIQFTCGDKTVTCLPGTLVHVPPHALHSFRYGPGGGKMLEITGEGSRAIDAFTAVSEKFGSRTVDDSAAIGRVFRANGIEFAD